MISYYYRQCMEALYPLFFGNLADNIPSVRQGAAVALAKVAKAYGEINLFYVIDSWICN